MKECSKCGKLKELNAFHNRKNSSDGKRSACRKCINKDNLEHYHQHRKGNTHRVVSYRYNIKQRYGLTEDQFSALYYDQNGCCAICDVGLENIFEGTEGEQPAIDHCHDTLEIRGMLCRKCNSGIGLLGDTLDGVLKAVEYLTKFER